MLVLHSGAANYRTVCPRVEKGYAVVCMTTEGIYARVSRQSSPILSLSSTDEKGEHQHFNCALDLSLLKPVAKIGLFWSYVCGTATILLEKYGEVLLLFLSFPWRFCEFS